MTDRGVLWVRRLVVLIAIITGFWLFDGAKRTTVSLCRMVVVAVDHVDQPAH